MEVKVQLVLFWLLNFTFLKHQSLGSNAGQELLKSLFTFLLILIGFYYIFIFNWNLFLLVKNLLLFHKKKITSGKIIRKFLNFTHK